MNLTQNNYSYISCSFDKQIKSEHHNDANYNDIVDVESRYIVDKKQTRAKSKLTI